MTIFFTLLYPAGGGSSPAAAGAAVSLIIIIILRLRYFKNRYDIRSLHIQIIKFPLQAHSVNSLISFFLQLANQVFQYSGLKYVRSAAIEYDICTVRSRCAGRFSPWMKLCVLLIAIKWVEMHNISIAIQTGALVVLRASFGFPGAFRMFSPR